MLNAADGADFTDSITKLNRGHLQIENPLKNQLSVTSLVIKTSMKLYRIYKSTKRGYWNQAIFEICEKLIQGYFFLENSVNFNFYHFCPVEEHSQFHYNTSSSDYQATSQNLFSERYVYPIEANLIWSTTPEEFQKCKTWVAFSEFYNIHIIEVNAWLITISES